MSRKIQRSFVWFLLALTLKYASSQVTLELSALDPPEVTINSGCTDGLVSDVDLFTVRGKANSTGYLPGAFNNTNLYLEAMENGNTSWQFQCQIDLTVCGANLTADCYCEREDNETGEYYLVMRIMVKSKYADGGLRLIWNDGLNSVTSNVVGYYHGYIRDSCPDSLPFMELDKPDPTEIIKISSCVDALVSDMDRFTVRGKVNKNGSIPNVFDDTGLYLQASQNVSTDAWESQCRLKSLAVCAANLTDDCYCESLDEDGYYHLVMKVMAKSMYSGGKLRFAWSDSRSPSHPPVASNVVDYYDGTIRERVIVTSEIQGDNGETLYQASTFKDSMDFSVKYTTKMRNVSFCVFELAKNRSIQINDGQDVLDLAENATAPCVIMDLKGRNLTMTFKEMEGCERNGTYRLILMPEIAPEDDDDRVAIVIGVTVAVLGIIAVVAIVLACMARRHRKGIYSTHL